MPEAPPTYKHRLFVLDDAQVVALAANDRFAREFPFLRGVTLSAPRKPGCGTCGGGQGGQQRRNVLNSAKQAVAGMGGEAKRKLKQMLSAKEVRVVYRSTGGTEIKLTF